MRNPARPKVGEVWVYKGHSGPKEWQILDIITDDKNVPFYVVMYCTEADIRRDDYNYESFGNSNWSRVTDGIDLRVGDRVVYAADEKIFGSGRTGTLVELEWREVYGLTFEWYAHVAWDDMEGLKGGAWAKSFKKIDNEIEPDEPTKEVIEI